MPTTTTRKPIHVPAEKWDRMAAIADFFGGVAPGVLYVDTFVDTRTEPRQWRRASATPCCMFGMADAAEIVNIYAFPASAFRGWLRAFLNVTAIGFDRHIIAEQQARRLPFGARVPFESVMARAGFVRGEG